MNVRVITEPKVYLVGRQVVNEPELCRFLEDEGVSGWSTDAPSAGEALVETAGRLCYLSFSAPRPGGNRAYIGHILGVGHGSVLEHAVFNLIVTGVSRSLTHELVRHRVGFGFSQVSQRFVDESRCDFVEPGVTADDPELHRVWLEAVRACQHGYRALADGLAAKFSHVEDKTLRRKKAREAARSVLPNATEAKIFVTANARALRHFIELRATPEADSEIRRLAVAVLRVFQAEAPNLFGDFEVYELPCGGKAARTANRRV